MSCIHNDLQLFSDLVRSGNELFFKAMARCGNCGTPFQFPTAGGGSTIELKMPIRPVRSNGIGLPQPRVTKAGPDTAHLAKLHDDPTLRAAGDIPDLDDLDDAEELEPAESGEG